MAIGEEGGGGEGEGNVGNLWWCRKGELSRVSDFVCKTDKVDVRNGLKILHVSAGPRSHHSHVVRDPIGPKGAQSVWPDLSIGLGYLLKSWSGHEVITENLNRIGIIFSGFEIVLGLE